MRALARPTDNMPETKYVKGETRYMNIQKPGRAVGVASTLRKVCQERYFGSSGLDGEGSECVVSAGRRGTRGN